MPAPRPFPPVNVLMGLVLALAGCARVHVTRTVNANGTVIDEYHCQISEQGVGSHRMEMGGPMMSNTIENGVLKSAGAKKSVVGEPLTTFKGDSTWMMVGDKAAACGVLFETEKWLADHGALFTKQADGGFAYELPVDVESLRKALVTSGLLMVRPEAHQVQQDQEPPEPEPDEPPPPPLFDPEPPKPAPNQAAGAKNAEDMWKHNEEHIEKAWKAMELQVEIVMPGKIVSGNAKIIKDRQATWMLKPYDFLQEADKAREQKKPAQPMVLKVVCGPALPSAKADEERYQKLKAPVPAPK